MSDPKTRTAVLGAWKKAGAKARKGQLRLVVGDLFWYGGLRATGPAPSAPWVLELGCWLPGLTPEPEGGAIDCPLLLDVVLDGDPLTLIADVLTAIGDVGDAASLTGWIAAHPNAMVDRVLRDQLGIQQIP